MVLGTSLPEKCGSVRRNQRKAAGVESMANNWACLPWGKLRGDMVTVLKYPVSAKMKVMNTSL